MEREGGKGLQVFVNGINLRRGHQKDAGQHLGSWRRGGFELSTAGKYGWGKRGTFKAYVQI